MWDGEKIISLSKAIHRGLVGVQDNRDDAFELESFFDIVKIMQYTGLKNKNGTEIYENDIVRCNDQQGAVVVWKRYGFILDFFNNVKNIPSLWYNVESSEIEVIGNIYENPELIIYLSDDL